MRNAGSGIAVLHGWHFYPERIVGQSDHASLEAFRRLTRDLYVPAGDVGFWQGAFRDPMEPAFEEARAAVSAREGLSVEVLFGDHEGGQRTVSRFALTPRGDGGWLASVARQWSIDRPDPR